MENRRDSSVVVWLPDEETYMAADAISLYITGTTICIEYVREGEANFRKHESLSEAYDDAAICIVVNRTREDE